MLVLIIQELDPTA